jgi:hypothetical protein
MKEDLEDKTKCFFENSMVLSATFLDPRYRKFHFIKDDTERQLMIATAKSFIVNTYCAKLKRNDEEFNLPPPAKKKRISSENNFSLLSEENELEASTCLSDKEKLEIEIKNYCAMKIVVTEQSNPLDFYSSHRELFNCLSKFSKMVFSITASSTPSEEAFSTAGNTVSDQRSSLTPAHAEELVLIAQNKRLGVQI